MGASERLLCYSCIVQSNSTRHTYTWQ